MNDKIRFSSENGFSIKEAGKTASWLERTILSEGKKSGEIDFVFCDDEALLKINQEYLNHDSYTDIISFDYSVGNLLQGEIYISTERVKENAKKYDTGFDNELRRVMAHGILHFCGYKDKSQAEKQEMRKKEDEKLGMFHVEQF